MFNKLVVLIAMVFALKTVIAQEDNVYDVQYTVETYPVETAKSDHLIMFYTPWCGHSQRLLPTWAELAKQRNGVEGGQVRVARVDCVSDRPICVENNIFGVPTVKFFEVGNSVGVDYTGDRSLESLNNFIDAESQRDISLFTTTSRQYSPYWKKSILN